MPRSPLNRLLLKLLLWLPIVCAAWYYLSIVTTMPLATLVDLLMTHLFPEAIAQVTQKGNALLVATQALPQQAAASADPRSIAPAVELVFTINPLIYGWCVPLYTALILASPGTEGQLWVRWLLGMLILLPVQLWGIGFDIAKTVLFDLGPETSARLGFSAWQSNLVALGYQFGSLMLPAVAPLAIWIGQYREFVFDLRPGQLGGA